MPLDDANRWLASEVLWAVFARPWGQTRHDSGCEATDKVLSIPTLFISCELGACALAGAGVSTFWVWRPSGHGGGRGG